MTERHSNPPRTLRDPRLRNWLAAEAADSRAGSDAGAGERAEAELAALFEALPPLAPPAGFAAGVLARAGVAPVGAPAVPMAAAPWPRPVRWLTAAVLTVCAFGLVLGRRLAWAGLETLPNPLVALVDLAGLATRGVVFAASSLSEIPEWLRVAQIAAATPPVIVLGLFTVLVGFALLRMLRTLQTVESERIWSHA